MNYDPNKYRALGVGEMVEDGDCYVHDGMDAPVACRNTIGERVAEDEYWTFLRPIAAEEQGFPTGDPCTWRSRERNAPRKDMPVATGVLSYFPDAIRAVALCSKVGNEQHNPGTPMHWDRAKSGDEADALLRHFMERGTVDTDGLLHSTKVAWRALAMLQKELEGSL